VIARLAVCGVGLIGGSFALALKRHGAVREVLGIDRDPEVLVRAQALRIIDGVLLDAPPQGAPLDVLFLAAPVAQTRSILSQLLPWIGPHTSITDAGSTKQEVLDAAREVLGARIGQFVPGHPLSGRERHGPDAAQADLFCGRKVVLTPFPGQIAAHLDRVRALWEACGAEVVLLDAARHDEALAAVSHLPHLLAYALVAHVAGAVNGAENMSLAGGGFRDVTRIAASSPEMWRDIALANRAALLAELDAYQGVLGVLRAALERADGAALMSVFEAARAARRAWEGQP
jgi:prephenate dehydrogenase